MRTRAARSARLLSILLAASLPAAQSAGAAGAVLTVARSAPSPLIAGAAGAPLNDAALLVLDAFTMPLTLQGPDFVAPAAPADFPHETPSVLTVTPKDHLLAISFLGQARMLTRSDESQIALRIPGSISVDQKDGVSLLDLHGGDVTVREDLFGARAETAASYHLLATVLKALRRVGTKAGTIDRAGVVAAAREIFDGSRRLLPAAEDAVQAQQEPPRLRLILPPSVSTEEESHPAPVLLQAPFQAAPEGSTSVIEPPLLVLNLPEMPLLTVFENASLAGSHGDKILNKVFPHAFASVFKYLASTAGKSLPLGDRVRNVVFFLQGLAPEPIGDEIGPAHRIPIDAINRYIAWLNSGLGQSLPLVDPGGVQVLRDTPDSPKTGPKDLPDLRPVGGFHDGKTIFLLQDFLDLAPPWHVAAALLVLTLSRAGRDPRIWLPPIMAAMLGEDKDAVTLESLSELAGIAPNVGPAAIQELVGQALHGEDKSSLRSGRGPRPPRWLYLKVALALAKDALAALRARIPRVDFTSPYTLAAAMALLLPVMYLYPPSIPYALGAGVVMILLAIGRLRSAYVSGTEYPMDAAFPHQGPGDEAVLPTAGAKLFHLGPIILRGKKAGEFAQFHAAEGDVMLSHIRRGSGRGLIIHFMNPRGWETTMHIVGPNSDLSGRGEEPHDFLIAAAQFAGQFWPGLQESIELEMERFPAESRERARLGRFLDRFQRDLDILTGGPSGDSPVAP